MKKQEYIEGKNIFIIFIKLKMYKLKVKVSTVYGKKRLPKYGYYRFTKTYRSVFLYCIINFHLISSSY